VLIQSGITVHGVCRHNEAKLIAYLHAVDKTAIERHRNHDYPSKPHYVCCLSVWLSEDGMLSRKQKA